MTYDGLCLNDLLLTGELASSRLVELAGADGWVSSRAPDLDWTSREVVDHLCNSLAFYANHAIHEATEHQPRIRSLGERELTDADLARTVRTWVRLLGAVISGNRAGWNGWHPLGMADAEGFIGLAVNELLIHTHDVAAAHEELLDADHALCARLLFRLFPADLPHVREHNAWQVLLYANGRASLGSERRKAHWRSHPSPRSNEG